MRGLGLFAICLVGFSFDSYSQDYNWQPLFEQPNGSVLNLSVYNNKLVAVGQFSNVGSTEAFDIALFDGTAWESFGVITVFDTLNPAIKEAIQFGDSLLVIGGFDSINGVYSRNVALWDGSMWQSLAGGANNSIEDIEIFNNEVYVVGAFDTIGGLPIKALAKWNGAEWESVGGGLKTEIGIPQGSLLCLYDDYLVCNAKMDSVGNIACNNIALWDGANWITIPAPWHFPFYAPMIEWDGKLLFETNFTEWDGSLIVQIDFWDGTNFGSFSLQSMNAILEFEIYNNDLYAAGFDYIDDSGSAFSKWNGDSWEYLGWGIEEGVKSMCVFNGELYAGGWFGTSGNSLVKLIDVTNIEEQSDQVRFEIYPNPTAGSQYVKINNVSNQHLYIGIHDITGRELMSVFDGNNSTNDFYQEINLNFLTTGVYFYVIQVGEKTYTYRVIKQ